MGASPTSPLVNSAARISKVRSPLVRQVWIAVSPQSGCRPHWPVGADSQVMAGSNQNVSEAAQRRA
jgi:hypothetical protein